MTPLELARAYLPWANGGVRPRGSPTLLAVRGADGLALDLAAEPPLRALSPARRT